MAEVTGLRNCALNYPVYGVPFGVVFPLLDADGDPISPSSQDSEVSKNGDTFADCTNEAVEIGTGICYLLLTTTEMTADVVAVRIQSTGAKTTVLTLYPRKLVSLRAGTVGANAADGTTLQLDSGAVAIDDYYNGCLLVGTLDSNVEARVISDYVGSTKVCTVNPAFVTTPDNNDTFVVYLPEGRQVWQSTDVVSVAQTGDAYARLGAPAGASTAADVAAVKAQTAAIETDTQDIQGRLPAALTGDGNMKADALKIEGADPSDTIRDSLVDDATRIDASALNTLAGHDPGETIMGATDLGTGAGLTSLATAAELAKVPKSDSNVTWNATAAAQLQSEAADALNAYDPPTRTEATSDKDAILTILGTPAGASLAADVADVEGKVDDLESRLGTPSNLGGGATIAQNLADIESQTDYIGAAGAGLTSIPDSTGTTTLLSRLTSTRAGYLDNLSAGAVATAAKLLKFVQLLARKDSAIATDNSAEVTQINADGGSGGGAFANTTDSQEALRDRGDAAWITATGFSTLDAAGVRTALGMGSANMDTQLGDLPTNAELATALAAADDAVLAAIAALPALTAGQVGDAVLDEVIEGTWTLRQVLRLYSAVLLGKISGAASNAPVFRDIDDSKNRVSATTDADGNRSAVTLDES